MKIICIGRNYADHARELNNEIPKEPLFFLKPDTALLKEKDFFFPKFTKELHYECEIVVKIDKSGKNIEEKFASRYYSEITLGIDFTARDIQQICKEKGLPWEKAKGFDHSAPISTKWINLKDIDFGASEFSFYQNDELKQHGFVCDMIFSIDQIIAYVSKFITLKTGDLIFTGTPVGVGPVKIDDCLKAMLNDEEMFTFLVK
jgi:2-keto-4-pentenoate hydratase/2-oxohepta-3-ene-1,7-dioic acid hydratase in catechol pathway